MSKKKGLGKGLDALLPSFESLESSYRGLLLVDPREIKPNPYQPRKNMDMDSLRELSDSIKEKGIIQPLIVHDTGEGYELIAGERRLRASLLAELDSVPVIVKDIAPGEILELALIENIQREELNPLEEADAYARLLDEFQLTQESLSVRVGKKRSTIANYLRLINLPSSIKTDLSERRISMGHARAILALDSHSQMLDLRDKIVKKDLSVRAAERMASEIKDGVNDIPKHKPLLPSFLHDISQNLTEKFGTNVTIKKRGKKGSISIEFYSDEDLNRILSFFQ